MKLLKKNTLYSRIEKKTSKIKISITGLRNTRDTAEESI